MFFYHHKRSSETLFTSAKFFNIFIFHSIASLPRRQVYTCWYKDRLAWRQSYRWEYERRKTSYLRNGQEISTGNRSWMLSRVLCFDSKRFEEGIRRGYTNGYRQTWPWQTEPDWQAQERHQEMHTLLNQFTIEGKTRIIFLLKLGMEEGASKQHERKWG